jgi:hypothetical protein
MCLPLSLYCLRPVLLPAADCLKILIILNLLTEPGYRQGKTHDTIAPRDF